MKRFPASLSFLLLVTVVALAAWEWRDQAIPRGQVNVNYPCSGSGGTLTVAPNAVRTKKAGTVTWHPTAQLDSMKVWGKDPADHLFVEDQPDTLTFGGGDHTAAVLPDTGTYQYGIRAFCPDKEATIDPDIIVDRN